MAGLAEGAGRRSHFRCGWRKGVWQQKRAMALTARSVCSSTSRQPMPP